MRAINRGEMTPRRVDKELLNVVDEVDEFFGKISLKVNLVDVNGKIVFDHPVVLNEVQAAALKHFEDKLQELFQRKNHVEPFRPEEHKI